jgi:hypothetical protein
MRSDEPQFRNLYGQIAVLKTVGLILLGVILILVMGIFIVSQKETRVVVIENSGRAYEGRNATLDVYKNTSLYSAGEFIEAIHSQDAVFGPTLRNKAAWYLVPALRKKHGASINDSVLLTKMISSQVRTKTEWIIPPKIIDWAYPNSRVYANIRVSNTLSDGTVSTQEHHITVDGAFFGSTEERPSGYFVTRFQYLTQDKEIDDMINSIGGRK